MPPDLDLLRTRRAIVVAAHPDDETAGAGALLAELADPLVVHATDGSPANPADARAAGCATAAEYAAVRRAELLAALRLAGIGPQRAREIGFRDQEASLRMAELARILCALFEETRPAAVLTHPYEGGHPDHDAAAFGVHAACALMESPPGIFEFACYHGLRGWMQPGAFLPGGPEPLEIALSEAARARRSAMLECFVTQRETLRIFDSGVERFRAAPRCCFTMPPHTGLLNYERYDWGMTGARFRALAREALAGLGLEDGL